MNTQIGNAPDIPIDARKAFFPLRQREDGKILPSYQVRTCVKKFIVCTKWQLKTIWFEDISWFLSNEYGLMIMPRLK